jgi:transposase InsO family protein
MDILRPFHKGTRQLKYLVVAVDYFTKWVEAEPLATITSARVEAFTFKTIICHFGIPAEIVTDNGTQFTGNQFTELLQGLQIRHHFSSVEHPKTNGQAEAANKVILNGLKKRLENSKGAWVDNLYQVLWSYRTTPQTTTGETPFQLVYGTDAVIPVEIGKSSWRVMFTPLNNHELLREELDLVDEVRELARLTEMSREQQIAQRYNAKVVKREFPVGDLILRRASIGLKNAKDGKLAAN